jgi:truncated hemoglobin YjbI
MLEDFSDDEKNLRPLTLKHSSIHTSQFPRWLELFRETATQRCHPDGASVLIELAERMAETLAKARRHYEHTESARRARSP